ncbi:MAG: mechanosensitive ion channel family protein [Chitinophagaceae bacterium]
MEDVLKHSYWGNTVGDYLISAAFIVIGFLVLRGIKNFVLTRLKKLVDKTESNLDDIALQVVEKFGIPILRVLVIYWAIELLVLSPKVEKWLNIAYGVVTLYFIVSFLLTLVRSLLEAQVMKLENGETKLKQIGGIMVVLKILVWSIGLLALFSNLGYDVTTVLTGLGIGGIAIALAAQNILGDLFNYFVIFFDRPFEVGDFITVDDKKGTVEYIGIKTTRIRSITGEQLIISNSNLTSSRIHNFKRLESRRVVFSIGVVYGLPLEKLKMIPGIIKQIVEKSELVRFDRVHFNRYGDFSLDYEVVFFVDTPDYNTYMDILQQINFGIYEKFESEKIDFAFPTQTLIFNKPDA